LPSEQQRNKIKIDLIETWKIKVFNELFNEELKLFSPTIFVANFSSYTINMRDEDKLTSYLFHSPLHCTLNFTLV